MHGKVPMSKLMRAIGLMSGTSLDGIDAAFLETDGKDVVIRGPARTYPYDDAMRRMLLTALSDAGNLKSRTERPQSLAEAEQALTECHAVAVTRFLEDAAIDRDSVDVIGFHGQTVLHKPEEGLTVQLGLGDVLANRTGFPVIYDLRAADVEAGGQGAPLVPVYHRALTSKLPHRPVAVVNIGGVANVTWIGGDGTLVAFDTGPGNALLDDWMARKTGAYLDASGATAAQGQVDEEIVRDFLSHGYFVETPPKSLDRNTFAWDCINHLSAEDGAATLAAFTARAIAKAREHMPVEPALWIIAGGGRKNRAIMRMLAEQVHNSVVPAETVEFDGDALEAEAWAYLAVRSVRGLPITYPRTTGVTSPMSGGVRADPTADVFTKG